MKSKFLSQTLLLQPLLVLFSILFIFAPFTSAGASPTALATEAPLQNASPSEQSPAAGMKNPLKDAPGFFRDTRVLLNFRSYYLRKSPFKGAIREADAIGGSLSYRSGWLFDTFRLGAALYTSQPLYAPKDRDGTLLLASGQQGYTVLGQLYAQVKPIDSTVLTLYRQELETPYISRNENRMTPNIFEAYTLNSSVGNPDSGELGFWGGYVDKIKWKNDEHFIYMSEKAGANIKRGVIAGSIRYKKSTFSMSAYNYYSPDILNIAYSEVNYAPAFADKSKLILSAQYSDQRSIDKTNLSGGAYQTGQAGGKFEISHEGAALALAYTANTGTSNMRSPWSGDPGYSGAMVSSFNRAGEQAFSAKLSYDFLRFPLDGVSAYLQYIRGWDVKPLVYRGSSQANEQEFDADIQWRPANVHLKGFWLRVRHGIVNQYDGSRLYSHDTRVILNYDLPLL